MPEQVIRVDSIRYKDTEDGPWKTGIVVNEDQLIVGQDGKVVDEVWTYQPSYLGTIVLFKEEL